MRSHLLRRMVTALSVAVVLVALSAPVGAHHGWAGYSSKEFELTGTVEAPVSMGGAHATMKVKSGDQIWNLTLAPPARTKAAGLEENTLPVGAAVTVHGHRHSNAKIFEIKTERITHNGKTFNVYPDRT